jgi:hypothetical protein
MHIEVRNVGLLKGYTLRLRGCCAQNADAYIAESSDGSCGAQTADGIGARSANNSSVWRAEVRRKVVVLESSSLVGTAVGSWCCCCVDAGYYRQTGNGAIRCRLSRDRR